MRSFTNLINLTKMDNNEAREILIDFHTNRQIKYDTDPNHTYNELLTQAIDCAIQALGDGWIDVDVIPSETNYYTVYYMNQMDSGYRIVFFNGSRWIDEYGHEIIDITNYQPLPSPPKPKQT